MDLLLACCRADTSEAAAIAHNIAANAGAAPQAHPTATEPAATAIVPTTSRLLQTLKASRAHQRAAAPGVLEGGWMNSRVRTGTALAV